MQVRTIGLPKFNKTMYLAEDLDLKPYIGSGDKLDEEVVFWGIGVTTHLTDSSGRISRYCIVRNTTAAKAAPYRGYMSRKRIADSKSQAFKFTNVINTSSHRVASIPTVIPSGTKIKIQHLSSWRSGKKINWYTNIMVKLPAPIKDTSYATDHMIISLDAKILDGLKWTTKKPVIKKKTRKRSKKTKVNRFTSLGL